MGSIEVDYSMFVEGEAGGDLTMLNTEGYIYMGKFCAPQLSITAPVLHKLPVSGIIYIKYLKNFPVLYSAPDNVHFSITYVS